MTIRNKILATIGSLLIFLIMILLVIEVISRFFFGASIEGVIEIVGIFLALSVFAGFSPCEEGRQHVSAQLVIQRLSARTARIVKIFVYILAVITVAVMSWQTVLNFYDSYSIREALPGASFQMPVYWAKAGVFIGFIMFLIQLIVSLIRLLEKSKIITTEKKN